jgi:prepilin-type N-terminal cleavage/methylation domain-containing protein
LFVNVVLHIFKKGGLSKMTWLTRMFNNQKGVTLIELLVVVVILGIIAAVAIPAVMNNQQDAYVGTNQQNLKIIQEAVTRYQIDNPGLNKARALHDNYNTNTGNLITGSNSPLIPNYLQEIPGIYNTDGKMDNSLKWKVTVDGATHVVTISLPGDAAQ